MTLQEIYTTVINHLMNQGRPASLNGKCLYRAGELKCAVGCLIKDEHYKPEIEDLDLYETKLVYDTVVESIGEEDVRQIELLAELQSFHDDVFTKERPFMEMRELERIEDRFRLARPDGWPETFYS